MLSLYRETGHDLPRVPCNRPVLVALAGPPVSAQEAYDTPIEKELHEWVFFPCMSVRLSLALPSLEEDSNFVQSPRDAMVGVLI